ncbi:MAG: hypothetical protein U0W24_00015 [Bacteroidales bacterium]
MQTYVSEFKMTSKVSITFEVSAKVVPEWNYFPAEMLGINKKVKQICRVILKDGD